MASTTQTFDRARDLTRSPEQRIADLIVLQGDIEAMIGANVAQMRERGASWADVAEATGITRQGAQQRWGR